MPPTRLKRFPFLLRGIVFLLSATVLLAQDVSLGPAPRILSKKASPAFQQRWISGDKQAGWFDLSSRKTVRFLYNQVYAPTIGIASGWVGDVGTCNAGSTLQAYRDNVANRVNWYRAMGGVPATILLDPSLNSDSQESALMMSANNALNHNPPSSWACYSSAGGGAASKSNLCYGSWSTFLTSDPGCVAGYVREYGSNNTAVGHRRWLLYPQTLNMGTGDVQPNDGHYSTNSLWVIENSTIWGPRPTVRDHFVAWPPKGYVPYQVVSARWSFSYPGADFSSASVTMKRGATSLPVSIETVANGYGENTIVWIPENLNPNSPYPAPASDDTLDVTISNVLVSGTATTFSYQVTVFDPTASAPLNTPAAVFRDVNNGISASIYGATGTWSGGGLFAGDPSAAQNADGMMFVVARDTYGALWANTFDPVSKSWGDWRLGGGSIQGQPAITVATNGVAYIAVRDSWNSYWLTTYDPTQGFGQWRYLAGIFSGDPVIAASWDGSLYIVGKDNWGSLWSNHFTPASGPQAWQFGGGIVKGQPAIVVGTNSVAYIAVRDSWNSLWIARLFGDSWLGWSYGGGILSADPQLAAPGDGTVQAVVLDQWGRVWSRGYKQGSSGGWLPWRFTNGILQNAAGAGLAHKLYVAGRDLQNNLWWYSAADSQWTNAGASGIAAGSPAAAP